MAAYRAALIEIEVVEIEVVEIEVVEIEVVEIEVVEIDYSWFRVSSRRLLAVLRLFLASSCRIDTLDVSNFLLFRRV